MPSGTTHRQLTLGLQLITVPLTLFYLEPIEYFGLQAGITSTYFVNPDLDITTNRLGMVRHLGFEAYKNLVPHRFGLSARHWNTSINNVILFSHFPFVGTILRTILVLLLLSIPLLLFDSIELLDVRFAVFVYIGMAISDLIHIIADVLVTGFRRTL